MSLSLEQIDEKLRKLVYVLALQGNLMCHDAQHNDTQHNGILHKGVICDTQPKGHSA